MGLRTAAAARLRFAPIVVASAVLSSVVLGLSATGTLSAFTASIQNNDSVSTGGIAMRETDDLATSSTACVNSGGTTTVCALNKYGTGVLTPQAPTNTTTVRFTNTGTSAVSTFTMAPGSCTQTGSGSATDLCDKITVAVKCRLSSAGSDTTVLAATALSAVAAQSYTPTACIPTPNSAAYASFTFTVTLTGTTNAYQNLTASQPITWTFQNG